MECIDLPLFVPSNASTVLFHCVCLRVKKQKEIMKKIGS